MYKQELNSYNYCVLQVIKILYFSIIISIEIIYIVKLSITHILFQGLNPENNWRIGFVLLTFSATFLGYCFHGQQISDIVRILVKFISFFISCCYSLKCCTLCFPQATGSSGIRKIENFFWYYCPIQHANTRLPWRDY